MNEIFTSYAREDGAFVRSLVEELKQRGIDPWFDEEDIPKASPWYDQMLLGVRRCQDLVFIISPDSIKSEFCTIEVEVAIGLNKRIIPALLRPIEEHLEFLHPAVRAINWLRFDKDIFGGIRDLVALINSPKGWLGPLAERPSAILQIHYYDGSILDFPLLQDCYWVGRRPLPPTGVAGAIALPDPNPSAPTTSRVHFELQVKDSRWRVINRSKNGTVILPPSPTGFLVNESKVFAGHSWMIYRELKLPEITQEPHDPKETYTGQGQS